MLGLGEVEGGREKGWVCEENSWADERESRADLSHDSRGCGSCEWWSSGDEPVDD